MLEKLQKIDQRLFMLQMIDHWKSEDREEYYQLTRERKELVKQIERGE